MKRVLIFFMLALFGAAHAQPSSETVSNRLLFEGTPWFSFAAGASGYTDCLKAVPTLGLTPEVKAKVAAGSDVFFDCVTRVKYVPGPILATTQPTQPAPSSTARIFFSDLDSGPVGSLVTITGKGFGSSQGQSLVSVGGVTADSYFSWSDTKIVAKVGTGSKTGDLQVINAGTGQVSNGIPFAVRAGPVYFVSANGSGNGSIDSPMSPAGIYSKIVPGATFYFRGGSYTGMYGYTSYSDYSFTLGASKSGAAGNPVAFVGYPGEVATFSGHTGVFHLRDSDVSTNTSSYLTIANLRMVCKVSCIDGASNGYYVYKIGGKAVRLVNNVMSATYSGNTMTGVVTVASDGWRVYGNEIKDTGVNPAYNNNHAIYVQVGSSDVDLGWNYLHDLRMGHVIQVHTDTAFKYENVRIHDNLITAAHPGDSRGINVGNTLAGTNGSIYNNTLANLGQDFSGIAIYSGSWNIANNTLYNVNSSTGMIWLSSQYTAAKPSAVITNNILVSDGSSPYISLVSGTAASQVAASGNVYFGKGAGPALDTAPVNADPQFVSAATGDFSLKAGSPAATKGAPWN